MESTSKYRSLQRWKETKCISYDYSDFINLKFLKEGAYILAIQYGDSFIDINVDAKYDKPIVFFFHGAVQRPEAFKAPVFSGFHAVDDQYSRVLVSDSSLLLSDKLTLSWFGGDYKTPLQKILPIIFMKLKELLRGQKLLFAGGSGGGFAALYYSAQFPGSIAVASNPQTSIMKYYKNHVKRYSEIGFEVSPEKLHEKIDVSLMEVYKNNKKNCVFYMQNVNDTFHVNKHAEPFLTEIDPEFEFKTRSVLSDNLYFISPDWGVGHVGPPASFWKGIINLVLETDDVKGLFKSEGFSSSIDELLKEYEDDLVKNAAILLESGGLNKAQKLLSHYFSITKKPKPEAFITSFKVCYKKQDFESLSERYKLSQRLYPKGWVLKYHYSLILEKREMFKEALAVLLEIKQQLGERLSDKIENKILVLMAKCE